MEKRREGWLEERLQLSSVKATLLDRKMPRSLAGGAGWFYTLGSATALTFLTLALTGILLTMNYSPSPDHAYDSINFIMTQVTYGWLIRGIHHWTATAMVALAFLHALRVLFFGAYKYPRELTWIVGVLLLMLDGLSLYRLPPAVGPEGLLGHCGWSEHCRGHPDHRRFYAQTPS
ncbi:MAG: cytochrome b N-terminal domain-containing protein, partial [Dehalococcoidia bacterium]|nr:cytochrome b N-terminal domain-containing protein [Dehalococcoidia bacterium]